MKKITTIILAIVLLSSGCKKSGLDDDELNLGLRPYDSHELQINGYFRSDYASSQGASTSVSFFFQNGIHCYGGSPDIIEIDNFEARLLSGALHNQIRDNKIRWGVFQIDGSTIRYERWYPSSGGFPAYVREGTILNDTTFHITQSYRICEGQRTDQSELDELHYFVAFSPKIDSTNTFVP